MASGDAAAVFKRLKRRSPRFFFGVPNLYAAMLASPDFRQGGACAAPMRFAGEACPHR